MQIYAGLQLDGQRSQPDRNEIDALTTGPLGLLNVLETQLGLLGQDVSASDRVLQFRDLLNQLNGPHRFYHQSFAVDALGTAATLLAWRDQWHLHGMRPQGCSQLTKAPSRRLRDMGDLEGRATGLLAPGIGERLSRIEVMLQTMPARVGRITLQDPLAWWPMAWQRVLCRMQTVELPPQFGGAPADSMLGSLQAKLARPGGPPLNWREDGSLRVLRAETRWLAARSVADLLRPDRPDTLLCAPTVGVLDEVLAAAQLPRQGFKEPSPLRPALQLLPLMLGQMWQPVDIYGLLQFLTHPICPVPRMARTHLAQLLASSPGIGDGPAWHRTLQTIAEKCQALQLDWPVVRERIAFWVEHERFDPTQGAPLPLLTRRLEALAQYLQGRLQDPDPARQVAFNSGLSQTLTVQRALQALTAQGETHIAAQALHTLLAQATAQGGTHPLLTAQVGACRTITHPGAATEAAAQVIWWHMGAGEHAASYPWSAKELSMLQDAGACLPAIADLLHWEAQQSLRPLLACSQRLVLVLPPEGNETHPVWLQVAAMFAKGHAPRVEPLEHTLTDARRQPIEFRPLPGRRPQWHLPSDVPIPRRETESFSSLEAFVFNPFLWVLRYPARLRPSNILDVSDGVLLKGNLSHHLVERYVQDPDALTMPDAVFGTWFDTAFDVLVAQEGAVLRMPGRQEALAAFRRQLHTALQRLRRHWQTAQVVSVRSETRLAGEFAGGCIQGYGDLLVTRADGVQAIIDMKWGHQTYVDKLAHNRHLQLAIYGEIVRQQTGRWPHLAYFSLSKGDLLATNRDFFPQAHVVAQRDNGANEGVAHLWQRFLVSWRWRREQLDQGLIGVVLDDEGLSDWPPEGLQPELLNLNYNEYLTLAGWEDAR